MRTDSKRVSATLAVIVGLAALLSNLPAAAQMVYWTDGTDHTIRRSTLDGDEVTTLVSEGIDHPDGIAIDPVGLAMYWVEWGGSIRRADLNGDGVELLVAAGGMPRDVALDLENRKLYWIDGTGLGIRRADLDGDNVETVPDTDTWPGSGIAVDPLEDRIYWLAAAGVHRIRFDGTGLENFITSDNGDPRGLDLDVLGRDVYWANAQFRFIARIELPPTAEPPQILQTGSGEPSDVAVDPMGGFAFWTETNEGQIVRADLGWTEVTTIIPGGLAGPLGVASGPAPRGPASVIDMDTSPRGLALGAARPNPFAVATSIDFALVGARDVRLRLLDVTGRHIKTLVSGHHAGGEHHVMWDGTDSRGQRVVAGVYFVTLDAGDARSTRRLIMIR